MKTLSLLMTCLFLIASCSKDEPYKVEKVENNPPKPGQVVGTWIGALDIEAFGEKIHLTFYMSIKDSGSAYLLYVEDRVPTLRNPPDPLDTLFWHQGRWSLDAEGDTTLFYGDSCMKDDPLDVFSVYTCEDSIAMSVNIDSTGTGCENGCWFIKAQDMEQVILSLGVSALQYNMVKGMLIEMKRQVSP